MFGVLIGNLVFSIMADRYVEYYYNEMNKKKKNLIHIDN